MTNMNNDARRHDRVIAAGIITLHVTPAKSGEAAGYRCREVNTGPRRDYTYKSDTAQCIC